jgi:hypothetical protein
MASLRTRPTTTASRNPVVNTFTGIFKVPKSGLYQIDARVFLRVNVDINIPPLIGLPIQLRLVRSNTPPGRVTNQAIASHGGFATSFQIALPAPVNIAILPPAGVFRLYYIGITSAAITPDVDPLNGFPGFKYASL